MDRELAAARRAFEEAPESEAAARRLEAALLRAGDREAVRRRYRARFARVGQPRVADPERPDVACPACGGPLFPVADAGATLAAAAAAGRCLLAGPDAESLAAALEALVDAPAVSFAAADPERPPHLVLDAHDWGLIVSGLGLRARREAAVEVLQRLRGLSPAEARDLCRSPVVPVCKKVSLGRAAAAAARFREAGITHRITRKRRLRRRG